MKQLKSEEKNLGWVGFGSQPKSPILAHGRSFFIPTADGAAVPLTLSSAPSAFCFAQPIFAGFYFVLASEWLFSTKP